MFEFCPKCKKVALGPWGCPVCDGDPKSTPPGVKRAISLGLNIKRAP